MTKKNYKINYNKKHLENIDKAENSEKLVSPWLGVSVAFLSAFILNRTKGKDILLDSAGAIWYLTRKGFRCVKVI